MEGDWLTYAAAAERLNTTPEAVRQKAIRGRWQRTIGNDKRALVRLPDGWSNPVRTPSERPNKPDVRAPSVPRPDAQLIKALEAHVETLKAQLAAAEARIDKQADDLVEYDRAYAAGLAAERAKVEAERAKAERVIAQFAAHDAQHVADLAAERAQTEKAIAAFAALAERLDALAAERAKPWWRRLAG
jgi:DNA repair exonuclease SbcCD ATPase subunit